MKCVDGHMGLFQVYMAGSLRVLEFQEIFILRVEMKNENKQKSPTKISK
jgi:hypothetical protein